MYQQPQQPLPPVKRRHPAVIPGLIGGTAVLVAVILVLVFVVIPGGRSDHVTGQAEAAGAGPAGGSGANPASVGGRGIYLRQQPGDQPPPNWNSTTVTSACAVLPLNEVIKAGETFDGAYDVIDVGVPHDTTSSTSVDSLIYDAGGGSDGLTNCDYPGQDNKDVISLELFQAPENVADQISEFQQYGEDTKGTTQRSEGGMTVLTVPNDTEPNSWQVGIVDGSKYFAKLVLLFKGSGYPHTPQQMTDDFVTTVIGNLKRSPLPAPTYHYVAPYTQVPDPCSLFTAADFTSLTGQQDDIANREFQFGEREIDPDPGINLPDGFYTQTSCERDTLGAVTENESDGPAYGLHLDFEIYRTAQQARTGMYAECDPRSSGAKIFGPSVQVNMKLGDDRVCYPDEGRNDWRLTFRSGRTIIYMQNVAMLQKSQLQDQAMNVFAPVATQIAAEVANF